MTETQSVICYINIWKQLLLWFRLQ